MTTKTKRSTTSKNKTSRKENEATSVLPMLGAEGDECRECASPLATDQRYCLQCGARRSGPRVEFGHHLLNAGPDAHVEAGPTQAAGSRAGGDWGGAKGVAGGIAVLGIMLLLGVLIGRGQTTNTAQQPVVVSGTATTATTAETADKSGKEEGQGGENVDVGGAKTLDQGTLDALESSSGKDYFEASKNLPDTIATPGKAEKNDPNWKPGGGSDGVTIP
jgi:hypothetical protein